ncbi:hypothetical protein WA158_008199 [Blastocystis sp. Blastoise]
MSQIMPFLYHTKSSDECVELLKTNKKLGLTEEEAKKRLEEYGRNELDEEPPTPLWKLVLAQFDDFLVKILLVSALLSFILAYFENNGSTNFSDYVEPFVIILILVMNAIVGVVQENNAESALQALKKMQSETARCIRNGVLNNKLASSQLVPGDIITIRIGDKVPADCRVLSLNTTTLQCEESALTGESQTVQKDCEPIEKKDIGISEKVNIVYSSTTVTGGSAICVVVNTGMNTEIGKIHKAVLDASEEEQKTPLSIKIDEFGELLGKVIMCICVLVWVININQFSDPVHGGVLKGCIYYLKIAVSLGVAAIPEGLPAVITLCLALGTRSMVKKNCIVRKLPSVETLGCTTIICSDKTGTLTTNEMTVVNLCTIEKEGCIEREVEGVSYTPSGVVHDLDNFDETKVALSNMLSVCALCNDSNICYSDEKKKYICIGEPTEGALKCLVEKLGVNNIHIREDCNTDGKLLHTKGSIYNSYYETMYNKLVTLEFTRTRKSMSVICNHKGENILFVKGAPENIIERCTSVCLENGEIVPMDENYREYLNNTLYNWTSKSLRVMAFAGKTDLGELNEYKGVNDNRFKQTLNVNNFETIESGLTFYGLCGIKDPARPEVHSSIAACKEAGIRVFMITGDNKITAESIARDIGLFTRDEDISKKSFDSKTFMSLSESEQIELLGKEGGSRIFSRAEPTHKKHLISILKKMNEIVAMTGDGVNDAPALKQADIGIAMGISGTEVTKEASDMILTDDNFATIVSAIEQGRAIYQNMKAFIRYLISSNIGEVASIFLTSLLGIPENLSPVQLLWINLVTDGLPATALGFNPPDPAIMTKPPRDNDESLITPWVFFRYMVIGLYVGFATIGIFVWWYIGDASNPDYHPLVSWSQLSKFHTCSAWEGFEVADYMGKNFENACDYFNQGKITASTLSLTVLVSIEMLNSLNALSEDGSLLVIPPHKNMYLVFAILGSFVAHACILYIPPLQKIFNVVPLSLRDWFYVFLFSFPVILIDEVLKALGRFYNNRKIKERQEKKHLRCD